MDDLELQKELDFLGTKERDAVMNAVHEIRASKNTLHSGALFYDLNKKLAPYGCFLKAVATVGITVRSAYSYMHAYRNAVETLPAGAVKALMERNLAIVANQRGPFGEWTEAIKRMPPPEKGSEVTYVRWVDAMIASKPPRLTGTRANRVARSQNELLEDCMRYVHRAVRQLQSPAQRDQFKWKLIENIRAAFEKLPVQAQGSPRRRAIA